VVDEPDQHSLDIIGEYPRIQKIVQAERTGKYAAICRAMGSVTTPVVVFSDANCKINTLSLRKMMRHYSDPKVGAVAGEKKIVYRELHSALGQAEGWYWEYESLMKKWDAGLYTVTGAAGELFSIRKELFQPLHEPVILDDLVISLQVCMQGYRIAYEPAAFASELPSATLQEEEKRKIRIAAGAFQSLHILKDLLHPFRFPVLFFQFLSRRLFRWIISPLFLILLLFTNAWLVIISASYPFYSFFLGLQVFFYLLALTGFLFIRSGRNAGIAGIPFYFLFMNYCILRGFFRFIGRKQPVKWEKAQRQTA
jgi:cellulose synthase/poly-beta-1,6-N-acetylglucosamine synthase-like glycosyltransferase